MTYFPLTPEQHAWRERVAAVAAREIGPRAAETDRAARFPTASLEALRREGLWGLRVAQEHGGLGADALTTCLSWRRSPSTAPQPPCVTKCTSRPASCSAACPRRLRSTTW